MASSQVAPGAIPQPSFAGLGRRVAAHIVDWLIAIAVLFIVSFAMQGLRAAGVWTVPEGTDPIAVWQEVGISVKALVILAAIVGMGPIYWAFFEASPWQASFGKRLLKVYVIDARGARPRLGRSFGRSLSKCLFNIFYVWLISVVTVAFSA
jgi:uncharacterized RDD family membrane protein YckC